MTIALVAFLTLGAAALRLWVSRGLSVDEAITASAAHVPLGQLVEHLSTGGSSPPLYPFLLWAATRLGGYGELVLRLPSIIAGSLVVPVVAGIGVTLYDRRTGVLAALFATVAPLLVWYSQEAQPYAVVTLFAAIVVLGCARVVQVGGAGSWALFLLGASGLLWTQWSALVLVLVAEVAFVAVIAHRRRRREPAAGLVTGMLVSGAALALQLVPLAMLARDEYNAAGLLGVTTGAASSGVSFYTFMSNFSWSLWGYQPGRVTALLSAVWPLLMLLSLLLLGRGRDPRTTLLTACWLVPAVVLLGIGFAHPHAFDVRYFIAGLPALFALLGRGATNWTRGRWGRRALAGGILVTLVAGLADQQLNPANPRRYDFRGALAQIRREGRAGDVLFYEPAQLRPVLEYYGTGMPARPLTGPLPTPGQAPRVFLLAAFLDQPGERRIYDRQRGALAYHRRPARTQRTFSNVLLTRFG